MIFKNYYFDYIMESVINNFESNLIKLFYSLVNGSKLTSLTSDFCKWLLSLNSKDFIHISEKYLYVDKNDNLKLLFIKEIYEPEQIIINTKDIEIINYLLQKDNSINTERLADYIRLNEKKNELIKTYINKY